MRTKTLLLSAAVGAAGLLAADAQVYSVNSVGYVNLSVPTGFSMIANPLNAADNKISALIPSFPLFGNLYKWTGTGFDIATFTPGGWDKPNITLNPGEGAFVNVDTATTLTFIGEVLQGTLTVNMVGGFNLVASKVPQTGTASALGLTSALADFDNVYKWGGTGYTIFTYAFNAWAPSEPQFGVGESFFVNAGAPRTWTRNFSVNN